MMQSKPINLYIKYLYMQLKLIQDVSILFLHVFSLYKFIC